MLDLLSPAFHLRRVYHYYDIATEKGNKKVHQIQQQSTNVTFTTRKLIYGQ